MSLRAPVSCISAVFLCTFLSACGGSNNSQPPNNPVGSTSLLVNFGDLASGHITLPPGYAPGNNSDPMAKARLEVSSIVLTRTDGSTTELLLSPIWVEFVHVQGRPEPLLTSTAPQGDYQKVTITQMAKDLTYVYPAHAVPGAISFEYCSPSAPASCLSGSSASATFNINLSPAVNLGDSPAVLNLDLDFRGALEGGSGGVGAFPYFSANIQSIAAAGQQQPDTGAVESITGLISQANPTSLALQVEGNSCSLRFIFDNNTFFEGVTGNTLAANMLVVVSALTQANGDLLATHVQLVGTSQQIGVMGTAFGLCNQASIFCSTISYGQGTPPNLVEVQSYNSADPTLPETFQPSLASDVQFLIDQSGADLTNLSFVPQFDASSFVNGQLVDVFGDFTPPNSLLVHSVKLRQEAIAGTVSQLVQSNGQTTFSLQPINFGLFQTIAFSLQAPNGPYDITVIQQPSTIVAGTISEGANARVIGLLFFDSNSFTYRLVAHSIDVIQ